MQDQNGLGLGTAQSGVPGRRVLVKNTSAADMAILRDTFGYKVDPIDGKSLIFAGMDAAINAVGVDGRTNLGDTILVSEGYTETISAASGVDQDTEGIKIIGLGEGADRPTFTFSNTAATWTMAAANSVLKNVIFTPSVDSVVSPLVISAADCTVEFEVRDASSTVEFVRGVLTTADADRLDLNLRYIGFTAGNACVNAVRFVGGSNIRTTIDFFGKASTAVVEFHTTAVEDCVIDGYMYNSGTSDLSKSVVDTVTGSVWSAEFYDGVAEGHASGGDNGALALDDVGSVASAVSALQTDVGDASARSNLQSLVAMLGNPDSPGATIYASIARGGGGLAYQGNADGGMTPSQTSIVSADLAGFGDDFFNTDYYMVIVQNVNSIGSDPAGTMRDITDYVSATGTFTTSAFGANVEAGDEIIILHKSLAAMLDGFDANGYPAQAAGGIPNMLRQLITKQTTQVAEKPYADLTGYDTADAFTVTGDVMARVVGVVGGTGITSTSGTTTLSVGTTEDADALLPATTIDNSDFAATDVWTDNNPEDDAGPFSTTSWVVIGGGANIALTRSADDITAGSLTLYCEWRPLSSDGAVAAA